MKLIYQKYILSLLGKSNTINKFSKNRNYKAILSNFKLKEAHFLETQWMALTILKKNFKYYRKISEFKSYKNKYRNMSVS